MGSAMNDTTRQIGGALGVAILGSVFATAYANAIAPALKGLPAPVANAAENSVGVALAIAGRAGGLAGRALAAAARGSFIHAMDRGLFVGATVAVTGAIVALVWLPARALPEAEALELEHETRYGGDEGLVTERVEA